MFIINPIWLLIIAGLDGVAVYIDDIFVRGKDQEEHDERLNRVLQRIRDFGFKLKFEKCTISVDELKYLGYIVNKDGLKPDPAGILVIKQMPKPKNISELRSFLGAVNFYSKFIKDMRKHRGPLDDLLKIENKWQWNNIHDTCFDQLIDTLSSDLLLTHYNPELDIIVAADASNYGLGACILHRFPDGSIKAVCHASRSLTKPERHTVR